MGNALGRDIASGEEVVIGSHIFRKPTNLEDRVFICESGEGMIQASSGRRITGKWKSHPKRLHDVWGGWIDKEATIKYQGGTDESETDN